MGVQGSFFDVAVGDSSRQSKPTRSRSSRPAGGQTYDCSTCGLRQNCSHPQIKRYGKGRKKILIVGLCPGKDEDRVGVPFVGMSGSLLSKMCRYVGLDLDNDCVRTNVVACFKAEDPTNEQIQACLKNLLQDIAEVKPELIICLGEAAINSVLGKPPGKLRRFDPKLLQCRVVPSHQHNCWVTGSYHPSFFLRRKNKDGIPDDENLLCFSLAAGLSYLGKPLPQPLTKEGNVILRTVEEVQNVLRGLGQGKDIVAKDYETTALTPWEHNARLLCASYSPDPNLGFFVPLEQVNPETGLKFFSPEQRSQVLQAMREFNQSECPKAVQNLNMEEMWDRVYLKAPSKNFVHDTMLAAHVLNCNPKTTGLAFQAWEMTGVDYKGMVDAAHLVSAPLEDVMHYNTWDSRYTRMAVDFQLNKMSREGRLLEFNRLLHRGMEALIELRDQGVQVDEKILTEMEKEYQTEQEQKVNSIRGRYVVQQYERAVNKKFNPESDQQISDILYKLCKETPTRMTKKGGSVDEESLNTILKRTENSEVREIVESLFRYRTCASFLERVTNYRGLVDSFWKLHPCYNLHIIPSFRSSADSPNIQNVFKHNKELKRFRRCIVPAPGHIILEVDYGALEVRVIAMCSGDRELTRQIVQGVDMHRRWASECFIKPQSEITKEERFEGKNSFVFASFYGSGADPIARKFPKAPKGHIAEVQAKFWKEYSGAKAWQNSLVEMYCATGYVEGATGFRAYGPLNINKICNYPIQGPAFHLLLDGLVKILAEFQKRKLRSKILFEVHDSLTIDTVLEEAEEVVQVCSDILTSKRFDWQGDVPLILEWEISKNSWFDLKELSFRNCPSCGKMAPMGKRVVKKEGKDWLNFECCFCGVIDEQPREKS